jgi:two-component system, OmpR family, sensor histidine kinase KdpD
MSATITERLTRLGWRYALALLAPIGLSLFLFAASGEATTTALIFLLCALLVSAAAGIGPGLLTSALCFVALNYFFIPPRFTLHVTTSQDVLQLATFLVVALITSSITARTRQAIADERRRTAALNELYQLSQTISNQVDLDGILAAVASATCRMTGADECAISIADGAGALIQRAQAGASGPNQQSYRATIRDGAAVLGVVRVSIRAERASPPGDLETQLDMVAAQCRLAIGRAQLVQQTAAAQALMRSDALKSALISSVSHDLRTPLAVIKGATSALLAEDVAWDAATQRLMLQSVDGEIDQLNRIVGNMLDMSRIDAGALPTAREPYDMADLIGTVVTQWERRPAAAPLQLQIAPDLPLVRINPALIERVLANLLDNAGKYGPPGAPIELSVGREVVAGRAAVRVTIRDHGPGIAPDEATQIFEKFFRGSAASDRQGTGLGLAICRGIVAEHGGWIWASSPPGGGAALSFSLPAWEGSP